MIGLDVVAFALVIGFAQAQVLTAVTAAVAALTWKTKGLYRRRIALSVLDDLPQLAMGVLVGLAPAAAAALALRPSPLGGPRILLTVGTALVAIVVARTIAYAVILHLRRSGSISYPTLLVGAGSAGMALVDRIRSHPESGLRLVGSLGSFCPQTTDELPLLGTSADLAKVVKEHSITNVVIGYGGISAADLVDLLRTADRVNVEIHVVPRLFELSALRGSDDHIWGLPLVRLRAPAQRRLTWRVKRAVDVFGALVAILLTSPILLAVAIAVRLELGPGVLFRQTRIGLNGTPFELMKFRSMGKVTVDERTPWTVAPDSMGWVGRCIRRYSLDELPQLFNVLRGDMSMVGPRPERPEFVEQFITSFGWYAHRHRVPVGMTGLAAVNGLRGDTSIEDRATFDNWYIDNWSLWLDAKILVRTIRAVLGGTGA